MGARGSRHKGSSVPGSFDPTHPGTTRSDPTPLGQAQPGPPQHGPPPSGPAQPSPTHPGPTEAAVTSHPNQRAPDPPTLASAPGSDPSQESTSQNTVPAVETAPVSSKGFQMQWPVQKKIPQDRDPDPCEHWPDGLWEAPLPTELSPRVDISEVLRGVEEEFAGEEEGGRGEEEQEENLYETVADSSRLVGEFDPKNFLEAVPNRDTSGREMPAWKKQIMARQLAEKALKEDDQKKKREAEEARLQKMPPWKRALVEKREAELRAAREEEAQKQQATTNKVSSTADWKLELTRVKMPSDSLP